MRKALVISLFAICSSVITNAQWNQATGYMHTPGKATVGASSNEHNLTVTGSGNTDIGIVSTNTANEPVLRFRNSAGGRDAAIFYRNNGRLAFNLDNGGAFVDNNEYMTILQNGNIGLRTSTPRAYLDVAADATNATTGVLATVMARLPEGNSSGLGTYLGAVGYDTQPANSKSFALEHGFYGQINSAICFHRGPNMFGGFITFNTATNLERMRIDGAGNVAIGTTDPKGYKLAVAGKIVSEEVVVKLQGSWPDYVFEGNYELPALSEVESYIEDNKHLPGVPSEKEVKENGVALGEMNAVLLKKIEELTLYVIEQQKQINELQRKLNDH